jgi:hypothetical protein
MPVADLPVTSGEGLPSPEEAIVTNGFRRPALAIAERCLPAIIRETGYEELEELIAAIQWFGSSAEKEPDGEGRNTAAACRKTA